ncbi:MAG: SRPBCC domain-containing protein [Chitinophagaceae bacterium]
MSREIKHSTFFQQPVEVVWEYLTKPELLSQWLMQNDIQPVVGHTFQFRAKPAPAIDFDGIVYCEILSVDPFKSLSYSWKCNPTDSGHKINTVVAWTLIAKDNGTELNLHQTGFDEKEYDAFFMAMKSGWPKQIGLLEQSLEAGVKSN